MKNENHLLEEATVPPKNPLKRARVILINLFFIIILGSGFYFQNKAMKQAKLQLRRVKTELNITIEMIKNAKYVAKKEFLKDGEEVAVTASDMFYVVRVFEDGTEKRIEICQKTLDDLNKKYPKKI